MPSPLKLSAAADLVNVAIQKIWLKVAPKMETYYDKMYNVTTGVTDLYMKDSSLSSYGNPGRVVEQGTIVTEAPVQGWFCLSPV